MDITDISPPVVAGCLAAILVSGMLRGFTGFGFGLSATPLLALMLKPSFVVPLVLLLQVGSSCIGYRSAAGACDRRSTLLLGAAATVTMPIGIWLLRLVSLTTARLSIAGTTAFAVVILASGLRYERRHGPLFIVPFGLVAGVLGGLCAMPGPPVLAYYLGTGTPSQTARASMTLVFLVTGLTGLLGGIVAHLIDWRMVIVAIGAAPAMAIGIRIGSILFENAPDRLYRPVGLLALSFIAMGASVRAWA